MGFFLLLLLITVIILAVTLSKKEKQLKRFKPFEKFVDIEKEIQQRIKVKEEHESTIAELKNEITVFQNEISKLQSVLLEVEKATTAFDVGLYQPRYSFDTSEQYKNRLEEVRRNQKFLVDNNKAIIAKIAWTIGGKEKEGERITKNIVKLALRAFNGECDTIISKVKFGNVLTFEDKIKKAKETINKLGDRWGIEITEEYLQAMLDELHLVYEYNEKIEEEREEQRRIREEMREEEKAQRELEKARLEAEKEESRYQDALDKARKELEGKQGKELDELTAKMQALERQLAEAHQRKERALSQAQLTKSGHVYVISNIGSFGENVYKIGMTRRLEPLDRVKELSDASVPFIFDVHAVIYSENAPEMENQLHKLFDKRRVNLVNDKREFFNVTLTEIESAVKNISNDADIEFRKVAEAKEFRETILLRQSLN